MKKSDTYVLCNFKWLATLYCIIVMALSILLLTGCDNPRKTGELETANAIHRIDSAYQSLIDQTLQIDDLERARLDALEASNDVIIRPVALPMGVNLKPGNNHLGWPVSAIVGNTMLVAHHRTKFHHGDGPKLNDESSVAVVLRSTDSGETWSDPIDMRQFGVNEDPTVVNFGLAFGVIGSSVFLVSQYGVYRSDDEGISWRLLRGAMTQEQTGFHATGNPGPRVVIHPERGLVVPMGVTHEPFLDLFSSGDEGKTWAHERIEVSSTIHPLEPTAFYHNGHLIFVTRNHTLPFKWHQSMLEPERPAMLVSNTGWFPMQHEGLTNISSYRWPDTSDLDFNPVTNRYEAVVTNRSGGGPESERNEENEQTVNLWSISPEELYAGKATSWRFEGTLLRLKSGMQDIHNEDVDAAHPGGAVIDVEAGVQHIFIYCGLYATPAGIYRITRRLDTNELRKRLL